MTERGAAVFLLLYCHKGQQSFTLQNQSGWDSVCFCISHLCEAKSQNSLLPHEPGAGGFERLSLCGVALSV